jgi:general secretion pathway protein C
VTPRQVRIGVDIFAALVVASVGVALAGLSWRLLGDPGSRLSASLVAARPARPVDIAPLIALAPFGTTAVSGAAAQTGNLPLTLRGIIFARPTTASSALISVGDATPVVVRIGQSVGSSNVGSIEIDHVVLVSGGAQTILAFPNPAAVAGMVPATTPVRQPSVAMPAAAAGSSPMNGPGTLERWGVAPSGAGLAINNPSDVMLIAGLKAGDQVIAINGTPAGDAARNPGLLQSLMSGGSARIDIVRDGQRQTISVPTP